MSVPDHNCINDLLAAPIIRDAQNITWYAAGEINTWLCITKINGVASIQAFERGRATDEHQAMPMDEFRHRYLRADTEPMSGLTEELSCNHYAIGQLAMACQDAWKRQDFSFHKKTLALLAKHVPSISEMCERGKTISRLKKHTHNNATYAIGEALNELETLESLTDDPAFNATLDPWLRVQQLLRVTEMAHPDTPVRKQPTLYTLESNNEKSFLLIAPWTLNVGSGFSIWLDEGMRPLLVDYVDTNVTSWMESPGYAWELERPYPGTIHGWNRAMDNMHTVNSAPFGSLKTGTMRELSQPETLNAISSWANNPQPMAAWNDVDESGALVSFGAWAFETWTNTNVAEGQMLNSLLPPIDTKGAPGQFDAWRQLIAANERAVEEENETYSIDHLTNMESHPCQ